MLRRTTAGAIALFMLLVLVAAADEGPIVGMVTSIDAIAATLVVETASRGKTRQVTVYMRSDSKIVRFERAPEGSKPAFTERAVALGELKPGWVVSVKTRREGDLEIVELISVVQER